MADSAVGPPPLDPMEPIRISLPQLEALRLTDDEGRPLVESIPLFDPEQVDIRPLDFGDADFERLRIVEHPFAGAWKQTTYQSVPVRLYRLRGAHVHSSAGVVMVANRLVAETLQHVYPPEHGMQVDPETGFTTLQSADVRHVAGRAVHLLAAGAYNYYHWLIDAFSRLSVLPGHHLDDLLLVPPLERAFQRDSLSGLGRSVRAHAIGTAETVLVDELMLVPSLTGFGYYPPPTLFAAFDRLASGMAAAAAHRRIYIHRLRSPKRRLMNEAAVMERLAAAGYETLDLDGMALADQMRAFAEATHVVAPHGAGLTNLVFCRPGTMVCELQMDCYTNWLFRRLANLRGLEYGCVLGRIDGPWEPLWPHDRTWRMPLDHLTATLDRAGFL
ncbi:glycosyltransferase family 61 protein [Azospirillum isscasi]|uniref:Glycosyltransferase family 61 protein n=1 Tax=Azospirillum isscasi TaxID=3053926 RepID=A0ABU0WMJ6_9PROT|nr:glycosyltransferase family 61 protein [Azospirillum isscasi]MDQ2104094.1 glycosyltransferase family 61 protein [Azospirillum isscasi]